jgi:hypothetical protein
MSEKPTRRGPRLRTTIISLTDAGEFITRNHRHHKPSPGHKFSIGVRIVGSTSLVGVAVVGRPVNRHYDNGNTLEVVRTCTDGTRNANSLLYGAAWRAAKALGADRAITYTQHGESGASLRAAGWRPVRELRPRQGWNTSSRPRTDTHPTGIQRTLWLIGHDLPDRHETIQKVAAHRHETPRRSHCRVCGTPLDQHRIGRPRTTCSDSCRSQAARTKRKQVTA